MLRVSDRRIVIGGRNPLRRPAAPPPDPDPEPGFGEYGPAPPTISGLTLVADFDFGYRPLGPMEAEIPTNGGSASTSFLHPLSGNLEIVEVNGRRCLRCTAANGSAVRLRGGYTVFNEANPDFTVACVAYRRTADQAHTLWHLHAGYVSGTDSEIANTHRVQITDTNSVQFLRNGNSGATFATLGTITTGKMVVITRANLSSDNIGRGMLNGGTKASTAARNIDMAAFIPTFIAAPQYTHFVLGGQMIWRGGSSGHVEWVKYSDIDYARLLIYEGAATDGNMDTLNTWAGDYV